MKVKKEFIFLAVIIIGLSVYLITRQKDRSLYDLPQLDSVPEKQITKIEVQKDNNTINLIKKDENWFILPQNYPAADNKIKDMTATMADLTLTALVSEAQDYQRYELSDDNKISVKAWNGDKLVRNFDVGKAAPSFQHTFVKLADDKRVYHARNNFKQNFDVNVDDLRDKQVLSFTTSDIQQIKLTSSEGELLLKREKEPLTETSAADPGQAKEKPESAVKAKLVWQSEDGRKVVESKLDRMLSTLSNLNCDAYIDDRKKEDFSDPVYSIELKGDQTYSLAIFAKPKEDAEDHPAISSGNDYPFTLPGWQTESLMPKFDELVETAAAKAPENKK